MEVLGVQRGWEHIFTWQQQGEEQSWTVSSLCHLVWSRVFGTATCQEDDYDKLIKMDTAFSPAYQHAWMHVFSNLCVCVCVYALSLALVSLVHTHLWLIPQRGVCPRRSWQDLILNLKPDLSALYPQAHVVLQDWLPLSLSTGLHLSAKGESDPWLLWFTVPARSTLTFSLYLF